MMRNSDDMNRENNLPKEDTDNKLDFEYDENILAEKIDADSEQVAYIEDHKRKNRQYSSDKMELYDWVQCIISALLCGILIFMFVGRVIGVYGTSMLPTLMHGDMAIISNLLYTPQNGDIVIIQKDSFDEDPIVKRIIATEGQTVDIDFESGIVYVDGKALEEEYVNSLTFTRLDFTGEVTVPENCVFVLGDNRNASNDSRDQNIGMVDERCIIGKVYLIIFPGLDINGERTWDRVGSPY